MTGPASIEVTAPIAEGSLVVLRDVEFEPEMMQSIAEQMADLVGHTRFLIIALAGDGEVETWGPDVDLRERLAALLAETERRRPEPPPRPGSSSAGGWQGGARRRPEPPPRPS